MEPPSASPPVVVGVDGSDAAVTAALWAAEEAVRRGTSLRLVCVTDGEHSASRVDDEFAERALRRAAERIRAADKLVSIETAVLRGNSADALIAESRTAALVCVGSTGIDWIASKVLGSTAQAVAEHAHCPVAVIRHGPDIAAEGTGGVIVVGFQRVQRADEVFRAALAEARIRHAPLIAVGVWQDDFGATPYAELERCVAQWTRRYPDVHVYPVPSLGDLPRFLADNADGHIQLAVLGADEADQVTRIVGPQGHSLFKHGRCSVLVVR